MTRRTRRPSRPYALDRREFLEGLFETDPRYEEAGQVGSSVDRDRTGAGVSPNSYRKHRWLQRLILTQANAYHCKHPQSRILLIDTNSGDGHGVREPQLSFWEEEVSRPSPLVLADVYREMGATGLIVCERMAERRESLHRELSALVPTALVLDDNRHLMDIDFLSYDWALIVSDPCGYSQRNGKGHPIQVLQHIMSRMKSDAIITFNRGALARHLAVADEVGPNDNPSISGVRKSKGNYLWMDSPEEWRKILGRRIAARSRIIPQSSNYKFQLIVVANYLADHITRNRRNWEISEAA